MNLDHLLLFTGIDASTLTAFNESRGNSDGLLGLLNMFTGGAFDKASIFALGIMPCISHHSFCSIVGNGNTLFSKITEGGIESGRRKINNITRWLTILIQGGQAPELPSLHESTFH